ncbi:TolB family protein [Qipengyuania gelatinilytica]|uniref:WD40 repeat protein n=1 Tax=Qipengyuania gelatinilytica TaxID=2867231 RepID=A0ABX9A0I3_9SPHN|nr:hypothetical protein [Qipengyuania gelatinilytica]QZD94644.1 hypothetical protein K3136_11170 [Qipengyuania gelatinilytica]
MSIKVKKTMGFLAIFAVAGGASAAIVASSFGPWSAPENAEEYSGNDGSPNSPQGDGCPILDPMSNDLYIASTRPGGFGGLDIWIAPWEGDGWGEPVNAGSNINSVADEFCPTPTRGNRLYFVSKKDEPNGDIYVARRSPNGGFGSAQRLAGPINSPAQEWSPTIVEGAGGRPVIYFSSTRDGGQDIYVADNQGQVSKVESLSTEYSDARPNLSRDGLEIVFDSDRPGGKGASDIWTATRATINDDWNEPQPIEQVNSDAGESRASISWDGSMLVFGSNRAGGEGSSDVYVSERSKGSAFRVIRFPRSSD